MMLKEEVRGTASIMPTGPQTQYQKIKAINIIIGERCSLVPINFGSTTFAMVAWVRISELDRAITCHPNPY